MALTATTTPANTVLDRAINLRRDLADPRGSREGPPDRPWSPPLPFPMIPALYRTKLSVALVLLLACFASCSSTSPDKRLLQYLNQEGFGKRYTGNAEEENWITIDDQIDITD